MVALMCEPAELLNELRRNGHVLDPHARLTPLHGGVSSEIFLVEDGAQRFVVKRALAKLKVKDDWFADVRRNVSERNYLECVHWMMPGTVPELRFVSPSDDYFGMEFLGEGFTPWKQLLLAGDIRITHAELAGSILGEIHERTTYNEALRRKFDTTANFYQLRIEPYLLTTGARHVALQEAFDSEAARIASVHEALVHGDFSPKNILIGADRMVVLDCEVAWYGDPTFDVGFFLSHLFLKWLYFAPEKRGVENLVVAFWRSYAEARSPANAAVVEHRLVRLLLMLLLARVDGKSPVEYLSPVKQNFIRSFVHRHLPLSPGNLVEMCDIWFAEINAAESIEADR
jgi:aminoglycoside phosphotransferase (APT) family kinase protein